MAVAESLCAWPTSPLTPSTAAAELMSKLQEFEQNDRGPEAARVAAIARLIALEDSDSAQPVSAPLLQPSVTPAKEMLGDAVPQLGAPTIEAAPKLEAAAKDMANARLVQSRPRVAVEYARPAAFADAGASTGGEGSVAAETKRNVRRPLWATLDRHSTGNFIQDRVPLSICEQPSATETIEMKAPRLSLPPAWIERAQAELKARCEGAAVLTPA